MSAQVEQENISQAIKALSDAITGHLTKPIYFRFEMQDGELVVSQVEYLTPEELAAIAKVDRRTVYGWIERGLLKFCRPEGTAQNLIPMRAALHWIEASETVKEPKKKPS